MSKRRAKTSIYYEDLMAHLGHDVTVAVYGFGELSLECEDCFEVIVDFDR